MMTEKRMRHAYKIVYTLQYNLFIHKKFLNVPDNLVDVNEVNINIDNKNPN